MILMRRTLHQSGEPAGALRIGLAHYYTPEEVDRIVAALREAASAYTFLLAITR